MAAFFVGEMSKLVELELYASWLGIDSDKIICEWY